MKFSSIIFDFNGVLLWDSDLQTRSWQRMATKLRGREMTREEISIRMHGRTNADVLAYLTGHCVSGQVLGELIQTKETFYRELCLTNRERFVLSPGAGDLLDWITEHDIPHTIATSSEIVNLNFFIQHLQLDRWFEVDKIVHDDGVRPGKPAPDIYLEAARALGVEPPGCIVVEDAVSGIASAHAAGVGFIVALGAPSAQADLLELPGVSVTIESLSEFPRNRLSG